MSNCSVYTTGWVFYMTGRGYIRLVAWPWPVFRLKRTKFRFVFRSKKAQISLLISFYKKKSHISQNFTHVAKFCKILRHLLILASNPSHSSPVADCLLPLSASEFALSCCTSASSKLGSCQRLRCRVDHQTGSSLERRHVQLRPSSV